MTSHSDIASLPESSRRVLQAATASGLVITIQLHAQPTRTAEEAAQACGCDVAQIVKSLVFRGADTAKPYLLLVSGRNRVDEAKVAGEIGEALRRPDGKDVRALSGFAIGGIPPFGHAERMETLVDPDLLTFNLVWAAAGTPNTVFAITPTALVNATVGRVVEMKAV